MIFFFEIIGILYWLRNLTIERNTMAKIQKVDLNLGQKIISPLKTKRNSSTNPFKYQDFEGNTIDPLVCADVLVSFKAKPNKLKLISSSVVGSMTKLHSGITEPIINFVKRIGSDISSVWNYAKNTSVSDAGKDLATKISGSISSMSDSISNIGNKISDKMPPILKKDVTEILGISDRWAVLNTNLTDLGKGISSAWDDLICRIPHHTKITKDTQVEELRAMWEAEIAAAKEAA